MPFDVVVLAASLQCWQSYSLRNPQTGANDEKAKKQKAAVSNITDTFFINCSGKLQNLTPKLGLAGRELIFEEESFSGNLEDLIQNLQTLKNLASNTSMLDNSGPDKVDVVDEDKGRSIKEDFVFNDVGLGSVDDVEGYKDELDPIYGLDDPNDIIDIEDVVASVTIRVDDTQEEISRGEDKNKDMDIGDVIASVTIRVDDIHKEIPRGEDKDKNVKESGKKGKTNGEVKKNKTEEGGWVWRKKRERSRRQVLDAVLVPCQDHQLCIISGHLSALSAT